jgi:hypothetical protein
MTIHSRVPKNNITAHMPILEMAGGDGVTIES